MKLSKHLSKDEVSRLYDITYHAFEVRIGAMYHGRGGAMAVGVSAACEAQRVYDRDVLSHALD